MDVLADFLSTPTAVVFAAVWGAIWGSFYNVVIGRLPRGESLLHPPSRCPACGTHIKPWDNVPVLAYLWLRGRCRRCRVRISVRYPLVELLTAVLAAAIFWKFSGSDPTEVVAVRLGRFAVYFSFVSVLLVLSFIDLDTKRLPDIITIPGTGLLFAAAFAAHDVSWRERLIGLAAGYLFVRIIADFYYYVLKREGLGLGDGKLLALIGAVLGWKALPVTVFAASVLGTLISIPFLLLKRPQAREQHPAQSATDHGDTDEEGRSWRHVEIPFGPFLAVGALIYLFAGAEILALVVPSE